MFMLTDRSDMTLDVYHRRKTTMQQICVWGFFWKRRPQLVVEYQKTDAMSRCNIDQVQDYQSRGQFPASSGVI